MAIKVNVPRDTPTKGAIYCTSRTLSVPGFDNFAIIFLCLGGQRVFGAVGRVQFWMRLIWVCVIYFESGG